MGHMKYKYIKLKHLQRKYMHDIRNNYLIIITEAKKVNFLSPDVKTINLYKLRNNNKNAKKNAIVCFRCFVIHLNSLKYFMVKEPNVGKFYFLLKT